MGMRKVSTGKYNCMKGTVPLLFFTFPLLEAEKNLPRRNVYTTYAGSV